MELQSRLLLLFLISHPTIVQFDKVELGPSLVAPYLSVPPELSGAEAEMERDGGHVVTSICNSARKFHQSFCTTFSFHINSNFATTRS